MNVLVISTMYPNFEQPVHAVFVEQRVRALASLANLVVLSPIPWFPGLGWMSRYAHRGRIPRAETRHGVRVIYPRFLSFPRFFKPLDGVFLACSCWLASRQLAREGWRPEVVDAHLAFPDGWGAVILARHWGIPVTVTLRGHDLNDLPKYPIRRRQVAWTLRHADEVFAVADALREAALSLGALPDKTRTVGNGVDAARFTPIDRREARRRLGLPEAAPIVVSVGHLVERKGFHHIVRALPRVRQKYPEALLVIVGGAGEEGDYSAGIRQAVDENGLTAFVKFAGAVAHDDLAPWIAAADVFCLASEKEGRANVLLEALACGTPIVATRVWGTPEIVNHDSLGILVDSVDPETLGGAIGEALSRTWERSEIVQSSRRFSWDAAAKTIHESWSRMTSVSPAKTREGALT